MHKLRLGRDVLRLGDGDAASLCVGSKSAHDFILGWPFEEGLVNGARMIDRAFSPYIYPLASETRAIGLADGLGWYSVAPSVLGSARSRAVSIQPSKS
jgi:hypothetical protein